MAKKIENKNKEEINVLVVADCDRKNINIESLIHTIRGQKVMFDFDLAITNPTEYQSVEEWRLQIVTSNFAKMGLRRPPYAFTRNGIGGNALSAKVT